MAQALAGRFFEGLVDPNRYTWKFPLIALRAVRQQSLESIIPQAEYYNPYLEFIQ
jgi:hypothetical protein